MELSRFVELKPEEAAADNFLCHVCQKILIEPHAIECCDIHVCEQCLENYSKEQEKEICPKCQSVTEPIKHIRYGPIKRKINELKIYCTRKGNGCKATICVKEDENHLKVCSYVEVECSHKCGQMMLRKDLKEHTTSQCPKRPVECNYCKEQGEYEVITGPIHQNECPDYPVGCPRKCNDGTKVKRKDLETHTHVCPQEPTPCPDCKAHKPRHLLGEHRSECPKRKVECEIKCGKIGAYDEITGEHVSECPERVLACPNKCGLEEIKRKDLKRHTEECPLEPVPCPFGHVGCESSQLVRQELKDHLQSNMQYHLEIFIAAYSKLDMERCKVKSELAKVKRAQHGTIENLNKMTESILHGLSLMESSGPGTNYNDGMACIKSALNPNINGDKTFQFHIPIIQETWYSQPFQVLDQYKVCLMLENQTQASTDGRTSVVLCLMMDEDQHFKERVDYPPELELTIKFYPTVGKPMAINLPINELKSNLEDKKFSGIIRNPPLDNKGC
jgi:hypothetical protein